MRRRHPYSPVHVKSLTLDTGRMSASCVFTTTAVDRVGDVVNTVGINTALHRLNPCVLLDHGMTYPLPIGKTEDEDGNYLVELLEDYGTQTTYFSQSSPVAEQAYKLIEEGILRGNSLRFENAEIKRLGKGGRLIESCDLVEVSWVVLPCNQECVTGILSAGSLAGKALQPSIKSLLTPYQLPRKSWANGAKMDEDEDLKDDVMPEEEEQGPDEPFGASLLRNVHGELVEMVRAYEGDLGKLEQPKAKSNLSKLMGNLRKAAADVEDWFSGIYPEASPLESKLDPGEQEDDKPEDDKPEDDKPEEDSKNCAKCEKLLKLIKELDAKPEEEKDEPMSHEDEAKLKRLERAIARRERMVSKIVSG